MKEPKKKFKEMTTSEITEEAKKQLALRNVKCWRNNNIRVPGRTFIGERGSSDLLGLNKATGIFVACEVKKIGDTLSDKQIEFLADVQNAGGFALVATQNTETGLFEILEFKQD